MVATTKEVKKEVQLESKDFISKNHEAILIQNNLQLEVRNVGGMYRAFVSPLNEGMTDKQIADNFKKSLQEISKQSKGTDEVKQFNLLMATLIENADKTVIDKVQSADQNFLKEKFISKINDSSVKLGDSSVQETTKSEGSVENARSIILISKKEFEQWLVEKEISKMKKEGTKATHEKAEDMFGNILANNLKKEKSKTGSIEDNKGEIVATTLATGAKANEELVKKDVKGVVAIMRDDAVEKNMLDKSKEISEQLYEKTKITEKDKNKFGTFKDKEGNLIVRMKHADGKWKDSVLSNKEGINEEALRDLCYVANIYKSDTSTKSREKNGLSLEQAKEIRKIVTDIIFSVEGVKEAYDQANDKYKKDRKGYELSKDGFAAGYLYEILRQNKNK